jgi:hypothetical protein
MSNQNRPLGLTPISSISGAPLGNLERTVYAPASYASNLFINQPVKIVAGGANTTTVNRAGGPYLPGQLPIIEASDPGDAMDYILVSQVFDTANEDFSVFAGTASTERVFKAIPAALVICQIQSSETGAFAVANVNACADIVGVSGDTTTGFSSTQLATTYGTTGQLKVLGVSFDLSNSDAASANVNLDVVVNESNWLGNGTGV